MSSSGRPNKASVSRVLRQAGWRPRNQERMGAAGFGCQGDRNGQVWVTYRPDATRDAESDVQRTQHIEDVIDSFARILRAAGYPTDWKPGARSLYVTGGKGAAA